jgi:hypothetical protein
MSSSRTSAGDARRASASGVYSCAIRAVISASRARSSRSACGAGARGGGEGGVSLRGGVLHDIACL